MQGMWVLSLVRELRSHMLWSSEAHTLQLESPHATTVEIHMLWSLHTTTAKPGSHKWRIPAPQQSILHDTIKSLHATAKPQGNQIK